MSISRRDLYAAGEPFGDGATRRKLGGGLVCGVGGDSSTASDSDTTTLTEYVDSRMVTDGGSVGVNTGGGNATVTTINNTVDSDVTIAALNDNAFNTASIVAAATALNAQGLQSQQLNVDLTRQIAGGAAGLINQSMSLVDSINERSTNLVDSINERGAGQIRDIGAAQTRGFESLLDAGLDMFRASNVYARDNLDLTQHLADSAASAYSNATAEATGSKKMVIVGMVAVAIVAAVALWGKK
jgi:hypothetical protein